MTGRTLRLATVGLAALGMAVAAYLTFVHYAGLSPVCLAGGGSCEKVQTSEYADVLGVPVALLGLVGYGLIGGLALFGARLAPALLAVGACAFSAYLTYLELFVIEAICQWCVASAVIATLLAVAAGLRYLLDEPGRPAVGAEAEPARARVAARS